MYPSVILINPKYIKNVATTVRAAACFGAKQVVYTGERANDDALEQSRIPRELRMKAYYDAVDTRNIVAPFDYFPEGTTFVAVEFKDDYEPLPTFVHPEKAVYVFGPEDGTLHRSVNLFCHRFVKIPSAHCLNLAMAVNVVLYDRACKEATND
jgi:tRNA(Leu) C34 or U34 (ribose-2'-O)-methylase TrmL